MFRKFADPYVNYPDIKTSLSLSLFKFFPPHNHVTQIYLKKKLKHGWYIQKRDFNHCGCEIYNYNH